MNYIYLLAEIFISYFVLVILNWYNKKDGLFLYIAIMSSILGLTMFEMFDIMSFRVNANIPIVMGIFIANNVIIQKYGLDEVDRIIKTFLMGYIVTFLLVNLASLGMGSDFVLTTSVSYYELFGYTNMLPFLGGGVSIAFMLWINGFIYYSIRRSKNKLLFSNVGSILIIQLLESIIFILISYLLSYEKIIEIFGMVMMRYLIKVIIGLLGLLPVYMIVKRREK